MDKLSTGTWEYAHEVRDAAAPVLWEPFPCPLQDPALGISNHEELFRGMLMEKESWKFTSRSIKCLWVQPVTSQQTGT